MSGEAGAPDLTPEQLDALSSRDRDIFLQAGAGTGKTTVLVERLCATAIDDEAGLDGVLAFTFTERAAGQLRERVRSALELRADAEADPVAAAELRRTAHSVERGWISTIHGFCRRLLANHPAAAGIDPRFRVIDEPEAGRLAARALTDAIRELLAAEALDGAELVSSHNRRVLREAVLGVHAELRSRGEEEPSLPIPELSDLGGALAGLRRAAEAALPDCEEASGEAAAESCERMRRAATTDSPNLAELQGLEIISGAAAFKREPAESYKRALRAARRAVAERELGGEYEALRRLVELFDARYIALKSERSGLDFEDLQLRTAALLRDNDVIREAYRERFTEIMVDEFQDTNELQLELIELLRGAGTRLFTVGDEFQSIYAFRHADLDIYRRVREEFAARADSEASVLPLLGNFRSVADVIATNNALGDSLLSGFTPLTVGREREQPSPPRVELLCTHDEPRGAWGDEDVELPGLSDQPSPAAVVAEGRVLASRLAQLRDEQGAQPREMVVLLRAMTHVGAFERPLTEVGLRPYVVGGRGYWSQQQVEDLRAILGVISNPLDDEGLFGTLAGAACGALPETLWLLRRLASEPPEQEGGRDRLFHVWPSLERWLLRDEEPDRAEYAGQIDPAERERLRVFCERLSVLRRTGVEPGLEGLVARAARTFGYDLATLARPDGRQRWANVRKLLRLARDYEADEGPDLAGFVAYLEDRAARDDREGEAATEAEGHDGVRLMTVHAAKGLQFPIVAVAHLGRNILAGFPPALRVAPGGPESAGPGRFRIGVRLARLGRPSEYLFAHDELKQEAEQRDSDEAMRLAYVAATRAEDRLILSGTVARTQLSGETKPGTPVAARLVKSLLDGELDAERVQLDPPEPRRGLDASFDPATIEVAVSRPEPGAGAELLPDAPGPEAPAPEPGLTPPLLDPPSATPASAGRLSYSALSDFSRCGYRFYVERVLGVRTREPGPAAAELTEDRPGAADPPSDELAGPGDVAEPSEATPAAAGRRFALGNAVHGLLEWSAANRWREPGEERLLSALSAEGLEPTDAQLERAGALVANWLGSELLGELGGAQLIPEAPFVLDLGGSLVRGSIDLLVERPGGLLVIDYKTDRLKGADPADQMQRYEIQRKLYAVAASLRADGPVETAYCFLERADVVPRAQHGPVEITALREELVGLVAELGEGGFGVTPTPHRALCHDCPAAPRLCSWDREARDRSDPEPVEA
ncbi:MAG: hypothetical protein EXQ70_08450 [Solirubrobacterales bacterium]|nr:hypothetical protein [Solirubrobacterales bacterium]